LRFQKIQSPGLSHTSYYISDSGEACVIDPRRDAQKYIKLAEEDNSTILFIFETHRNEDYLIGSREIESETDSRIIHGKETPFQYGEGIADGETFKVGRFKIQSHHTPGHTPEHMCYSLYDTINSDEDALLVFTGDTLFIGDVGRTDLPGLDIKQEMSGKMYDSIHEKILPLGDHVLLYPAHTAGSICGSNISDRTLSTLGYEKMSNPQLSLSRGEFIENRLNNEMYRPPYFRRMEEWNLEGPPLLREQPEPEALGIKEFEDELEKEENIVLDTRQPDAFAGSHIPDSLNIWLGGVSFYPGWVIGYEENILLLSDRPKDNKTAITYLHRIGYDDIAGYLNADLRGWRNKGKPIDYIGTVSATEAKKIIENNKAILLDVRSREEWERGHVKGATHIYIGHLEDNLEKLPKVKPIISTCGWGGRGGIGASILKRNDFEPVYNLLGGMRAWSTMGYPMVQE
jgi:hydroxyacylglutathione hydrolase